MTGTRFRHFLLLISALAALPAAAPRTERLLMTSPAGQQGANGQAAAKDLQDTLAGIDAARASGNLGQLQQAIERGMARFRTVNRPAFVAVVLHGAGALASYDLKDREKQLDLLHRYVFEAAESGDLPLTDQVQLVELLSNDPTLEGGAWTELRRRKARLWLGTWQRVSTTFDRRFNFGDLPFINVPPPAGAGVSAGSSPEAIRDPKLREEYQRSIDQNSAKARRYNEQYWLKQHADPFFRAAEAYLVAAYGRPPANVAEIEQLLRQFVADAAVTNRILTSVRGGNAR